MGHNRFIIEHLCFSFEADLTVSFHLTKGMHWGFLNVY